MKHFICITLVVLAACGRPKSEKTDSAPAKTTPEQKDDAVVIADQAETDTLKGSLRAKAEGTIGSTHVSIRYYSPAVRGRIIWGGLVPYGRVWSTGAHMATSVELDKDVSIAGTLVPAGKYGFFTFPGKDDWTVVINTNWQQHLADEYDTKLDVVRLVVKPLARDLHQERLQYSIVQDDVTKGRIVVRWERLEVALPLTALP